MVGKSENVGLRAMVEELECLKRRRRCGSFAKFSEMGGG